MKVIISLFFILFSAHAQTIQKPALNKEGILIFTNKKEGSNIKQYEAQMTVNASIDSVKATLLDIKNLKNWNYKTLESKLLKKINDSVLIVYMRNHLGWPLQDRDNIARISVHQLKSSIRIDIVPEKNYLKPISGIVRVEKFKGSWELKTVDTKKTKVAQSFYIDIGGNIPVFLINRLITQAPFETFKALRNTLENN
jgi:hypothetical protein